jgi:hypothetical protein
MSTFRRYEILIPSQFNDGRPVPDALLGDTLLELRKEFTAVSCETQIIHWLWEHEATVYRDRLVRVFVDVPDTAENRRFFVSFKERLKVRFEQLEIWLTTHPIEVI